MSAVESPARDESSSDSAALPVGAGIDYERFLDCVHCGLCTAACPTYLETGNENDGPRGRIYLMRGVVDGRVELNDTVRRHLDLCLDCRSCETACPSGVQYGRLLEPFREEMERRDAEATGRGPGWFRRWVLYGLFPYPNRLKWALFPARWAQRLGLDWLLRRTGLVKLLPGKLQRMHGLLPSGLQAPPGPLPEVLPAKGPKRARVGLFTGCVAEGMFGETNRATARVLQANGCEVVVPKSQVCCAAIHYHSGAGGPALEFARRNLDAFDLDELDAVIVNVAGCGSMIKDYGHIARELGPNDTELAERLDRFATKSKDVSEFLGELGPIPPRGELPLRATYHDACHLCHAQGVRRQPRELLSLIPGLELVPLEESEICCGAAGSYNLTEPEMADRLGARKVANLLATDPQVVVTGNAGCSLQIQSTLRNTGRGDVPVVHPMDLLDLSYRGETPRDTAMTNTGR